MVLSLGDMSSLEDLYQSKILEFARMARDINLLTDPNVSFTSKNPVCGDEVTIDLIINKDNIISHYGHKVRGCALCEASTGLLSKNVIGLNFKNSFILKENLSFWLNEKIDKFTFSEIENFFSTTNSITSWVLTVFSISSAIGIISLGFMSKLFGRKKIYISG